MLNDLTVLTPPLVVCAAFLIAVGAFLRHEMRRGRQQSKDDTSGGFSDDGRISGSTGREAGTGGDGEDVPDRIDGS